MLKDIQGDIAKRHKWLGPYPFDTPLMDIPCTCMADQQVAAKMVLPTLGVNDVIVWNNCARTLFASMKRHVLAVPLPAKKAITEYQLFVDNMFGDLSQHLDEFSYNYSDWFNHLNLHQQHEIQQFTGKSLIEEEVIENIHTHDYTVAPQYNMFCKREIQIVENPQIGYHNSDLPKNRAIASPQTEDKVIMGPVMWGLESLFAEHLPGYTAGKNYQEAEDAIQSYRQEGYEFVLYGDGSGWDRTQSHELKYFDRKVYDYLADNAKINHCDPEIFRSKSTARLRKLIGNVYQDGKIVKICKAEIDATVTSGNPDTTLMNTARMSVILHFIMSQTDLDYKIWSKGDDFIVFLKKCVDLSALFYKYWSPKGKHLNEEHGLGVTLKFLKTGALTDFDFCSTNLIVEPHQVKIVRMANRMYPLTHWSVKALSMSRLEQANYMLDIAKGIDDWALGMPYYGEYAELIRHYYSAYGGVVKPQVNVAKNYMTNLGNTQVKLSIQQMIDKEKGFHYNYSEKLRRSSTRVSNQSVYDFLFQKHSITKTDIDVHFSNLRRLGQTDLFDVN
jgi:hypothetical protein